MKKIMKKLVAMSIALTMLLPVNSAFANEKEDVSQRKKGEIEQAGKCDLADVLIALKAALGAMDLSGEQLFAADIFDDGSVDLNEVQIILKAVLGIESIDDSMMKNHSYVADKYLKLDVATDKESYKAGEEINVSLKVENTAPVEIAIYAPSELNGKSSCFNLALCDKNTGKVIATPDLPSADVIFTGVLEPSETVETSMTINVPKNFTAGEYVLKARYSYLADDPDKVGYVVVEKSIKLSSDYIPSKYYDAKTGLSFNLGQSYFSYN